MGWKVDRITRIVDKYNVRAIKINQNNKIVKSYQDKRVTAKDFNKAGNKVLEQLKESEL